MAFVLSLFNLPTDGDLDFGTAIDEDNDILSLLSFPTEGLEVETGAFHDVDDVDGDDEGNGGEFDPNFFLDEKDLLLLLAVNGLLLLVCGCAAAC